MPASLGCPQSFPPEVLSVTIILHDVDKDDWGAAGALMTDKYPEI